VTVDGSPDGLRPELQDVVAALAGRSEVSLDELAAAIGTRAASYEDVDALMRALEARGVSIVGPEGGGNEQRLFVVLGAARTLSKELGRRPTVDELVQRTGMERDLVWRALLLAQIMGR
jgi:hypothetical protein